MKPILEARQRSLLQARGQSLKDLVRNPNSGKLGDYFYQLETHLIKLTGTLGSIFLGPIHSGMLERGCEDLSRLGLELLSYEITEVNDDEGCIQVSELNIKVYTASF